jgi:hypothetical protein
MLTIGRLVHLLAGVGRPRTLTVIVLCVFPVKPKDQPTLESVDLVDEETDDPESQPMESAQVEVAGED